MKRLSRLYLTILIVTIILAIFSDCQQKSGKQSVHIACNLPLTGYFATYGAAVREGALMALSENAEPAVSLDFDWQDNAGEPKTTVTWNRLIFMFQGSNHKPCPL
jgi:outer membrane PBP1 activator LpoA protein